MKDTRWSFWATEKTVSEIRAFSLRWGTRHLLSPTKRGMEGKSSPGAAVMENSEKPPRTETLPRSPISRVISPEGRERTICRILTVLMT